MVLNLNLWNFSTKKMRLSEGSKFDKENIKYEEVHISDIKWGDTVFHDGYIRTVGKKDIKKGGFMGDTLWGDSYKGGRDMVKRALN